MLLSSFRVLFFFKQKTAYEMRISDWSSDVCSSDLAALAGTLALVGDVQGAGGTHWRLYALFFVFGGLAFSVYPLCVAHLLDHLPPDDLLAGCSSLLLFNGVGAALGPALAGLAMARLGPQALPAFFAVTFALLFLVVAGRRLWRRRRRTHPADFPD